MSEEARNKFSGWKENLLAWEAEPDKNLDKEVAWERLYPRLQQKRKAKPIFWYSAAAILLGVLTIPLFFNPSRKPGQSIMTTRFAGPSKDQAVEQPQKTTPANESPKPEIHNMVMAAHKAPGERPAKPRVKVGSIIIPEQKATLTEVAAIGMARPITQMPQPQASRNSHRELRVVNLNEIEGDWSKEPVVLNRPNYHYFTFKLGNQETLNQSDPGGSLRELTLIKSK